MKTHVFVMFICLGLMSCIDFRTEEEVQEEFQTEVAAANDCESTADCVLITPQCPLPCGVAVNVDEEARIRLLATRLVLEYDGSCDNSCPSLAAICEDKKCVAVESGDD
ncbi:MAG: hypothetical protein JXR76_08755 [Deltaproteobacteria bacterium]|nr:hypothetical protein [Deltaproteobacteria bacterium]